MAKYEEEIECPYCNSKFVLQYDDNETDGNPAFCCFCSEALGSDYEDSEEE